MQTKKIWVGLRVARIHTAVSTPAKTFSAAAAQLYTINAHSHLCGATAATSSRSYAPLWCVQRPTRSSHEPWPLACSVDSSRLLRRATAREGADHGHGRSWTAPTAPRARRSSRRNHAANLSVTASNGRAERRRACSLRAHPMGTTHGAGHGSARTSRGALGRRKIPGSQLIQG